MSDYNINYTCITNIHYLNDKFERQLTKASELSRDLEGGAQGQI